MVEIDKGAQVSHDTFLEHVDKVLGGRITRFRKAIKRKRKLRRSDVVVVSHAKSGRTWLVTMISHVYHQRYGIPEREIVQFDNFQRLDPRVPCIFFTHDNYKNARQDPLFSVRDYCGRKVVLLVRDPRDIAVSAYFQSRRNLAKGIPSGDSDRRIYHYIVSHKLPQIIAFLQRWQRQLSQIEDCLVIRYEDLRERPEYELSRLFDFIDGGADPVEIKRAVDFASFDALKKREANHFFASNKLHPADERDDTTFKVRRGKVGGYSDYLSAAETAEVDDMLLRARLIAFGYVPQRTSRAIAGNPRPLPRR